MILALTEEEIKLQIKNLPEWEFHKKKLVRTFNFINFIQAISFINKIALISEEQNHHPILINNYSSLQVKLYTHDVKGISQKDFVLAKAINQLL